MQEQINSVETASFLERTACPGCSSNRLQKVATGRFDEGAVKRFIDTDPWGEHPAPFLRGKPWSFVSCQNCGFAFHQYILSPDWNERRFSKWMSQEAIEAFEQRIKTPTSDFDRAARHTAHVLQIEALTRPLRGSAPTRLLDFGCGHGDFLSACAAYGFEACGVDRSAARRENNRYKKVFAEIEDVADMAPFHALTLFEVLEHLDEPYSLMLQLRDLLVQGGVLVLETPDCSGVRDIQTRQDYDKIHPLDHINAFTPQTMKRFAARLGFAPIARPLACVTCGYTKTAKTVVKQLLTPLLKPTTRMYFRKL
ncbi:MAG: class I SAM-dependent methyltransferase [Elainella sp.]